MSEVSPGCKGVHHLVLISGRPYRKTQVHCLDYLENPELMEEAFPHLSQQTHFYIFYPEFCVFFSDTCIGFTSV